MSPAGQLHRIVLTRKIVTRETVVLFVNDADGEPGTLALIDASQPDTVWTKETVHVHAPEMTSMGPASPAEVAARALFIGVFPTGISYADRRIEQDGDYKPVAFLAFDTLQLDLRTGVAADLLPLIHENAAAIQARRGQDYQISASGQTVRLGG